MKSRFTSADITAAVGELQRLVGMRVVQVYDVDSKTYLFKLNREEEKTILLFESGVRIHTTEYEWPKGNFPSGFSMKLRKHLNNKRIESIRQLGVDRIVDIQFGINEAAYHVIVEIYDRGNVVLTDGEYIILNILRPRQAGAEDVRFAVREKYHTTSAQSFPTVEEAEVHAWLDRAAEGDPIKKVIVPKVFCGPAVLDHCLQSRNMDVNTKIRKSLVTDDMVKRLHEAILEAHEMTDSFKNPGVCSGVITLKVEKRVQPAEDGSTEIASYDEFHPFPFKSIESRRTERFDTFLQAVDSFFSRQEEQRISMRVHNLEKEAFKKLENIKIDHEKRLSALETAQMTDVEKATLIQNNLDIVEKALLAVRSAIASQMGWDDIANIIKEARLQGDPVAGCIQQLHFERNTFSMYLSDPFDENGSAPAVVDIDIGLSAYANATKYFDKKRQAAKKQQKTLESSAKALKSAQKKTKEVLKQVELTTNIARSRKTFWFEKFFWFISSENYLVIGGRDATQNETIVKRYLTKGDVYVHADLHGASSVVIKNPSGEPIPPKTLTEAGTMAICYSAAWEAKVITTAWWVYHHQVSKTAPTGEYLSQGSFMVRGKKNYLPPLYLTMGFGFMFRLDEDSIARHADDRKVRLVDDPALSVNESSGGDDLSDIASQDQNEVAVSSSDDEDPETAFPDTQVQLIQPITRLQRVVQDPDSEETIVYSQAVKKKPTVVKPSNRKKDKSQKKQQLQQCAATTEGQPPGQRKKISKAKQRKIKQRYGDQDDEERQLRMKLLASAGKQMDAVPPGSDSAAGRPNNTTVKPTTVSHGESSEDDEADEGALDLRQKTDDAELADGKPSKNEPDGENESENEAENEAAPADDLTAILNSLTGLPVEEDVLLYAVPICAPYSTMTNYKYKVKLTPGTSKRGKAAKIALNMFQHDKSITQRERDLLRAAKDQEVARNMPGQVKMSAANLQKYRK
ncbi:nuclear export mediator factor NEMF-like [Tropilaelaps mercedesae]|uniref:Nuclear export mediator factor NEMF-like n=1 Tax=Tropilaelaps mercedesae TaxID=418985 RepID=A0A1V9X9K8_9ACAR|nr:nuclear export mediator factor NEMF-like [Tropilaelaps mercedesae]